MATVRSTRRVDALTFRVAGVPVRVHSTFAIPVVLPFLHEWFVRPQHALVFTAIVAVLLFSAVLLHELGHLWAARRRNIATERIELYLFGGRIWFKPLSQLRAQWAWIYAAGPMVNIAMGLLCLAAYYLVSASAGGDLQPCPATARAFASAGVDVCAGSGPQSCARISQSTPGATSRRGIHR
ncbi:site-2 protease family protein [Aminobacter sp. UC22_36]|uniref:site-2 protease family protein n=1 Tax=Aminobacter sp. UC22_36 TaxID=3374549 RepID=UPI0037567947